MVSTWQNSATTRMIAERLGWSRSTGLPLPVAQDACSPVNRFGPCRPRSDSAPLRQLRPNHLTQHLMSPPSLSTLRRSQNAYTQSCVPVSNNHFLRLSVLGLPLIVPCFSFSRVSHYMRIVSRLLYICVTIQSRIIGVIWKWTRGRRWGCRGGTRGGKCARQSKMAHSSVSVYLAAYHASAMATDPHSHCI